MEEVNAIRRAEPPSGVSIHRNRSSRRSDKKVRFCESANLIVHPLADDGIMTTSSNNNDNSPIQSDLWYTNAEIIDMAHMVRVANSAVNDACGDFDAVNTVEIHRTTVLKSQPAQMVEKSRSLSDLSLRLARLQALSLESDLFAIRSGIPFSYDTIRSIVQNVMSDEDDDETESIGTIDYLQQEEEEASSSWGIDGSFSSAIETPSNLVNDDSREVNADGPAIGFSSKTETLPFSTSTSWRDETPNQTAFYDDSMESKDQAMIDMTVMSSRGRSIPHDGSFMDEHAKLMTRSRSSSPIVDNISNHQHHVDTKPIALLSVTSASKLPDDKRPMPFDKGLKSNNMISASRTVSILKKRTHSSRDGSKEEESALDDKDHVDCCRFRQDRKRSRAISVGSVSTMEGKAAGTPLWQSPVSREESKDDDCEDETVVPTTTQPKDECSSGQVANAIIALARWEFRAHLWLIRWHTFHKKSIV